MSTRPDELPDRPWRKWASIAIISVLAFSVVFGFILIPVIQGRSAGIGAYDAICRALGLAPGSPGVPQPKSVAAARPTTRVTWSSELLAGLSQPTAAGAKAAAACAACHGARGVSPNPELYPDIGGQSAVAIYKQLHDFKSGSRASPVMSPIAQALSEQQIIEVAAHFAAFPSRALPAAQLPPVDADIARLVERGDPARGLAPCNACHGARSGGPTEAPALTHQSSQYLAAQLRAFKSGSRGNDIYARMRNVAAPLTEREIDGLAAFYASTSAY